jgi:DNA invertase Pin-like site-specific DNA recombinase
MKTFGYARVSTNEQGTNGVSLDAQAVKIRQQAGVLDLPDVEVISEVGSGSCMERDGLQRLVGLIEAREVSMVIVAKLDRLTRSVRDLWTLLDLFDKRKVSLVSVADALNTSTASGRMVISIMMTVSQWEREAIGERTRDALGHIKEKGFRVGTALYGYKAPRRTAEDRKQGVRHLLTPDPAEQALLNLAKAYRKAGESLPAIARLLNEAGHRTRRGGLWSHQGVANILGAQTEGLNGSEGLQ